MPLGELSNKVSITIFETIDNIKQFEYENWYKTVVASNHGVWIGDGIADQYTIKASFKSEGCFFNA